MPSRRDNDSPAEADAGSFLNDPTFVGRCEFTLPMKLLLAIRKHAPAVLGTGDFEREVSLRKSQLTGEASGRTLFSDVLDAGLIGTDEFDESRTPDLDDRRERRLDRIVTESMSVDLRLRNPEVAGEVERHELEAWISDRQKGYAGWLITNPAYWRDVTRFAARHPSIGSDFAAFPNWRAIGAISAESMVERPESESSALTEYSHFLNRWGLDRCTTCWIPEPRQPALFGGERVPQGGISPSGISLFLPWWSLSDKSFDLRKLVAHFEARLDLDHLQEWRHLRKGGVGKARTGPMLDLLIYWELGLRRRYPTATRKNTKKLEIAFASYLYKGDPEVQWESVKLVRRELKQRLKSCQAAIDDERAAIAARGAYPPEDEAQIQRQLAELEQAVAAWRVRESLGDPDQ